MEQSKNKFHGWGFEKDTEPKGTEGIVELMIDYLPNRKRPSLVRVWKNEYCCSMFPLATFRSEEAALEAQAILDRFILRKPSQREGEESAP